jgi:hypothetical protein
MKLTCYAVALVVFGFGSLQFARVYSNPPLPFFCTTVNGCIPAPDIQWDALWPR